MAKSLVNHWLWLILLAQSAVAIDYDAYDDDVATVLREFHNQAEPITDQDNAIKPSVLVFNAVADSSTVIDFEAGVVAITATSIQRLQDAIVEVLLTQIDPSIIDARTAQDFGLINNKTGKPFFWQQIVDHKGKPIEHAWSAEIYADYLTKNIVEQNGRFKVDIAMVEEHKDIAGGKYIQLTKTASRQHGVPVSLMMAIMETESAFNPLARSGSNALGLMQIKATTAGRDYFSIIKGYSHTPSASYLYKPRNNIEVAAGYLRILQTRYLSGIEHPQKLHYAMISSYNGGAGNLWRSLDRRGNKTKAIARINKMTVRQFYRFLTHRHIRAETRSYVRKVTAKQNKYRYLTAT